MLSLFFILGIVTLLVALVSPFVARSDGGRLGDTPARPCRHGATPLNRHPLARSASASLVPRLFGCILAMGMVVGACANGFGSGQLESLCDDNTDCRRDLECKQLQAIGYWGGLDSGGAEAKVCTTECTTNRDCPSRREAPCGSIAGTCEDGWCRDLTICEG